MDYIDPHAPMTLRTAVEYRELALSGCVALAEPVFWAELDRSPTGGVEQPFDQLATSDSTGAIPSAGAIPQSIRRYTYLCLSSEEGEREPAGSLRRRLPGHLAEPSVVGLGPIGLRCNSRDEVERFKADVALALEHGQLILAETPGLEDKYKGTRLILRALKSFPELDPRRVLMDGAEEHTVEMIRDHGFGCGLRLSDMGVSCARAADMLEVHGAAGLYVSSACRGANGLMTIPHFIEEMRRRQHAEQAIRRVVYDNPAAFLSQCPKFSLGEGLEPELAKVGT